MLSSPCCPVTRPSGSWPAAVSQAKARAFWGGGPQLGSYRRRLAEGEGQWAEFLAEPPRGSRIRVDPIVHAPHQAWTVAESLGETVDAVHAAQLLDCLSGAAFAFASIWQFTYATPLAHPSLSMTPEHLTRPLGHITFVPRGDLGRTLGVTPPLS